MIKSLIQTAKLTRLTIHNSQRYFTAANQSQEVKYLLESLSEDKITGKSPTAIAHELLRFTSQKQLSFSQEDMNHTFFQSLTLNLMNQSEHDKNIQELTSALQYAYLIENQDLFDKICKTLQVLVQNSSETIDTPSLNRLMQMEIPDELKNAVLQ